MAVGIEAETLEEEVGAARDFKQGDLEHLADEAHEFDGGELFVEEGEVGDVGEETLGGLGLALDVVAAYGTGAGGGTKEAGEKFDGGGLPAALGPRKAKSSPGAMSRVRSSTAFRAPKVLVRLRMRIMGEREG